MERAERFTELYKMSGLNQTKFAKSLGITQSMVSKILAASAKPSAQLLALAELLYGKPEEKSALEFHRQIRIHCTNMGANCEICCMRLFCYTPPCERSDALVHLVISLLPNSQTDTEADNHSSHRTSARQMPCPCNLDMSNAPGSELR